MCCGGMLFEKLEYCRIRGYSYYEGHDREGNFEDGLYLNGPYDAKGTPTLGVKLHSNWANYNYVLGQLAFRIVNERWAEPDSDDDHEQVRGRLEIFAWNMMVWLSLRITSSRTKILLRKTHLMSRSFMVQAGCYG